MNALPNELIILIFETILLITDKRQFLRTCNKYNILTKQPMIKYENDHQIKGFDKISEYCVDKFTLELSHDKYFDRIPEHYIVLENLMLVSASAYFGNILLLDKLKSYGYSSRIRDNVFENAAMNGQLDVLKWAYANDYKNSFDASYFAAINGQVDVLKWLGEHSVMDIKTCIFAAANGHLEVLKWAKEIDYKWEITSICDIAASRGYLHILQWAHENGYPWYERTCALAALNNQLPCLKYARENGCNWNNEVYANAKSYGHTELLNWAVENGCPL